MSWLHGTCVCCCDQFVGKTLTITLSGIDAAICSGCVANKKYTVAVDGIYQIDFQAAMFPSATCTDRLCQFHGQITDWVSPYYIQQWYSASPCITEAFAYIGNVLDITIRITVEPITKLIKIRRVLVVSGGGGGGGGFFQWPGSTCDPVGVILGTVLSNFAPTCDPIGNNQPVDGSSGTAVVTSP